MMSEVFMEGSEDDLGMEDELSKSSDSDADSQQGKHPQKWSISRENLRVINLHCRGNSFLISGMMKLRYIN